jgi:small subunit ribosomal protein S16
MTKQPTYRFVVTDSRNARDSRSLATLGHYNPRTEPIEINVDADKAKEWMSKGAKPSDTVDRLFRQAGVLPKLDNQPIAPARGPRKPDKQTKAAKRAAAPPPAPAAAAEAPSAAAEAPSAETEAPAAETETPAEAAASEVAAAAPEDIAEAQTDEPAAGSAAEQPADEPAEAEASAEPAASEAAESESEEKA